MNQNQYYFRVGLVVVVGIALLAFGVALLSGSLTDFRTYAFNVVFADARGVTEGADVQMAGVVIGRVESVRLTSDNRANLRLRIQKQYPIPRGSSFIVSSGLLGGASVIQVNPVPNKTGAIVEDEKGLVGTTPPSVDTAIAQSEALLASFQRTAVAVEKIATDVSTRRDIQESMRNVRLASESLPQLARTMQTEMLVLSAQAESVLAHLDAAANNGNSIARNTAGLTADMRATLAENRATLREVIENTNATASAFRGLTEQLNETLQGGEIQRNLIATTANMQLATARLDAVTANFERLSSDPRLSQDIREITANLRETSASVRALTARIEGIRLPGERRPGGGTPPTPEERKRAALVETGAVVDGMYDFDASRLRIDANYTLPLSNGRFVRAGIADFTERNRLNLQVGQTGIAGGAVRYGLTAGKLGLGGDLPAGPLDLRFDLYDPNRLTLDLRAKATINESLSALVGVNSVGHGNHPMIGIQIRR